MAETLFYLRFAIIIANFILIQKTSNGFYPVGGWVISKFACFPLSCHADHTTNLSLPVASFGFAIDLIVLFWMNLPFGQTLGISVIGISLIYIILPSATGAWAQFSYETIDAFISLTPKWSEISKQSPGKSYLPHS